MAASRQISSCLILVGLEGFEPPKPRFLRPQSVPVPYKATDPYIVGDSLLVTPLARCFSAYSSNWYGWQDSNLRYLRPKRSALTWLDYTHICQRPWNRTKLASFQGIPMPQSLSLCIWYTTQDSNLYCRGFKSPASCHWASGALFWYL